jgi:WD repeat-containing protein 23
LIRAYFSPLHSTGQRYIISGSSCGDAFLYDAQTGAVVDTLKCHSTVVRELSWHPRLPKLVTASYDGSIALWEAARPHTSI